MFNSTLSITGTNISRVGLLLCAEFLRNRPFKIGPLSEGLELRHLPLHDALDWKRANQLIIEPTLLAAVAKTAKDGQVAPKGLDGTIVTRVAMRVDMLARLHQQIQQVLVSLREARQAKPKA